MDKAVFTLTISYQGTSKLAIESIHDYLEIVGIGLTRVQVQRAVRCL